MMELIILNTFVFISGLFVTFASERELNNCTSDTRTMIRLYLAFSMTCGVASLIKVFQNEKPELITIMFLMAISLNLIACKRRYIGDHPKNEVENGKA